jgi:energy-coupling factor transporter ATP-binding protein EcfA2
VPLLLLTGPAGSGKSELSTAMTQVSANAVMIGQVSAPTMMRLIDSSGGLCVIDDLESVGVSPNSKNGQQKFSEISQVLKVSYKKSSATRMVTNVKTMRTEVLNFFGCKIISNTKGVDDILGSRMIHIHTRHMPSEVMPNFKVRDQFTDDDTFILRNLLHTWAFTHVNEVNRYYRKMYTSKSNRQDEIAAPLRVLAKMSGSEDVILNLEQSLSLQTRRKRQKQNPEDILFDVAQRLIGYGYREVATSHIMMELRRELDPGYQIDYSKEMPGWSKKEWTGRKLREMSIVEPGYSQRKRLFGSNLRLIKFTDEFIKKTLAKNPGPEMGKKSPTDFCTSCESCPYRNHQC